VPGELGWFDTLNPVDLTPLARVARGGAAVIDRAARRKILHRIADAIEERAEEIAFLECLDTGQALRFMSKAALRGAENFRFFADKAPEARDGKSIFGPGQINVTSRAPIGPVGIITPWNTPFMLSTWKIAPALAAGCTVVHKPAEFSPLTARLLVEIAEDAGFPRGVEPGQRHGRGCGPRADRTPGHPRHRLCRRNRHRAADHGARGGNAETGAL